METAIRKPYQGIKNIILFNSAMYSWALSIVAIVFVMKSYLNENEKIYCNLIITLISFSVSVSIIISFYIYDCSDLYKMKWLNKINIQPNALIANISAGFDETSDLLKQKLSPEKLTMLDFYDETKHTEKSIKLAREFYPPHEDLIKISTDNISIKPNSFNYIFLILAAHEIRSDSEKILFFEQLKKTLIKNGTVIIVEHQRNFVNFLAYNIGFLHFFSNQTWLKTFSEANFILEQEFMITPFIKTYVLKSYGNSF